MSENNGNMSKSSSAEKVSSFELIESDDEVHVAGKIADDDLESTIVASAVIDTVRCNSAVIDTVRENCTVIETVRNNGTGIETVKDTVENRYECKCPEYTNGRKYE